MSKKKLIISLLSLTLALSATTACDPPSSHTHTFGEWSTVHPASCTEDGEAKRICSSCNEEETKAIPAYHDCEQAWNWTTDYSVASVDLYCKNCDFTTTEQVATITEKTTPSTCSTLGTSVYTATAIVNGKIDFSQKRGFISPEYCDICDQRYVEGNESSWFEI